MKKQTKIIRIILNVLITVTVLYTWWTMLFAVQDGVLVSRGFSSLKYFTVLSNLLEAFASVCLILEAKKERFSRRTEYLKYTACVAVALTFFTVIFFLGPRLGYISMFTGVSFWFHLIVPLAAMIEALIYCDTLYTKKEYAGMMIPLLLYGLFYIGNLFVNGYGPRHANDWYGFASWGIPAAGLIFCLIIVLTCAFAYWFNRLALKCFKEKKRRG